MKTIIRIARSILLIAGLGFIAYGITPIQIEIEVKKEKSNDKPESAPASASNPIA
ncbi:MAG: hypothetical protein LIP09_05210 [Bacteroidales bacterium]|nr:hypothetical protein [Bacteroidales bacterium]